MIMYTTPYKKVFIPLLVVAAFVAGCLLTCNGGFLNKNTPKDGDIIHSDTVVRIDTIKEIDTLFFQQEPTVVYVEIPTPVSVEPVPDSLIMPDSTLLASGDSINTYSGCDSIRTYKPSYEDSLVSLNFTMKTQGFLKDFSFDYYVKPQLFEKEKIISDKTVTNTVIRYRKSLLFGGDYDFTRTRVTLWLEYQQKGWQYGIGYTPQSSTHPHEIKGTVKKAIINFN